MFQNKAELIASFEANIATLTAERDALTDAERVMYVITCSDLPINVEGQQGVCGGMTCPLREATRFGNLRNAQAMARRVVNGMGERGEVVTLGSAYNAAIDDIVNIIHGFQTR